jgi:hypothetical protein
MLATRYDSFSYRDWLEEFLETVSSMLPTGLKLIAVFVKGGEIGNFKTIVPIITDG